MHILKKPGNDDEEMRTICLQVTLEGTHGGIDQGGTLGERKEFRGPFEDVPAGEEGKDDVSRAWVEPEVDVSDLMEEVGMGEHHAFGSPGGATGEDQGVEIGGGEVGREEVGEVLRAEGQELLDTNQGGAG